MNFSRYVALAGSFALALAQAAPVAAQTPGESQNMPWVEIESTSVMLGVGGQSGDGVLRLPNLGTNCAYPFTVGGFGAGIQVGVSKVSASGAVKNLTKIGDLSGSYTVLQGESTLIAGAGVSSMKNGANNVVMDLQSRTQGIALGFGAQGLTVKLVEPPVTAPRVFVVEFGFNKSWVSEESRATLDQVVKAWKCRYVNIDVVGHTDTVGKEDQNLALSDQRAKSVRDYLLGTGFVASRITTRAAGKNEPRVPTGPGVRHRSNRVVVLTVM